MKAISFSSSISANLGNSGEAMVKIHKYCHEIYGCHTFVLSVSYSGGGGEQTNYIFHMDYNVRG